MHLESLCPHLLADGDVVLDVGANEGQSAHVFSRLIGATGRCISFEPDPRAFASLAALAASPPFLNVEPHCRVISAHVGHEVLFFGMEPKALQASTIVRDLARPDRLGRQTAAARIECETLDSFCRRTDTTPDFVKIDVEGAENLVFRGAAAVLRDTTVPVVFEFGYGLDGGSLPEHFELLRDLGYRFLAVEITSRRGRAVVPPAPDHLLDVSLDQLARAQIGGNMLAVQPRDLSTRLAGVPQVRFSDVADRISDYTPGAREWLGGAVRQFEYDALNSIRRGYGASRAACVSAVRHMRSAARTR